MAMPKLRLALASDDHRRSLTVISATAHAADAAHAWGTISNPWR